jgi:hypothetical protein
VDNRTVRTGIKPKELYRNLEVSFFTDYSSEIALVSISKLAKDYTATAIQKIIN